MATATATATAIAATTPSSFTPLPARTFGAPIGAVALCPSMDLWTYTLEAGPLCLHRSLDFYALAQWTSDSAGNQVTAAVWSPDGRWLAVTHARTLTLLHVEAMVTHGKLLGPHVEAAGLERRNPMNYSVSAAGNLVQFDVTATVRHLHWAHGVPQEAGRSPSLYEDLRAKVVDRTAHVLPPSAIHQETNREFTLSSTGPLSILGVLTQDSTLDLYLQGQYPILQNFLVFAEATAFCNARVQACLDLSHWWISTQGPQQSSLTLVSLPVLGRHRYNLQSIAALYASVMKYLTKWPERITEVSMAYASSLKPLDLKWEALLKLLENYGLNTAEVPKLLARYILLGHAACTEDLSNAMDQFFTSIHMNDQLIQRMDRSLTVAVANVESLLRQVLAATQAIFVQVDELLGLSHYLPHLLPTALARAVHDAASEFVMVTEGALTALVESRFRLRDWIAWMRSTGASIKARGTAPASAQRENAKKRRMDDATLQRVLSYLQADPPLEAKSLSARIMGLTCHFWEGEVDGLVALPPSNTRGDSHMVPTLSHAYCRTFQAAMKLLDHPRQYLTSFVQRTRVQLVHVGITALGTRQGAVQAATPTWKFPDTPEMGYFLPTVIEGDVASYQPLVESQSQWSLVAQGVDNCVHMYAVPLSSSMPTLEDDVMEPLLDDWDEPDEDDDDDVMDADSNNTQQALGSFYLSTSLVFPPGTVVHDLTFFGDDGKSALYLDGQVQERRQGLAVLLQRGGSSPSSMELWVVPNYDEGAQWEGHTFVVTKDDARSATTFLSTPQQICLVQPGNPADDDDSTCLWAKTRIVSDATAARLFVSGSRGVAAVVSEKSGGASHVALWDLQEDEEEDEDEDMADEDDEDP